LISGEAGPKDESGIWTTPASGGELHLLRNDATGASFSPTGRLIAFASGYPTQIWIVDDTGGNARLFARPLPGDRLTEPVWSPDGRRVAYLRRHPLPGGGEQDIIESKPVEGGEATLLLSDQRLQSIGFEKSFAWARDGRIIYPLLEDARADSVNLWAIRTDPHTYMAVGSPYRLTDWVGFSFLDFTLDADGNRLAVMKRYDQSDVYVGELQSNESRMEAPSRLTLDDRIDWPGSWTRDSMALLFWSDRGGQFDLFKQSPIERPQQIQIADSSEKRAPQLSPDGASIIYLSWPRASGGKMIPQGVLKQVPAGGGTPQVIMSVRGYPGTARLPRPPFEKLRSVGQPDFRCPRRTDRPCVVAEDDGPGEIVFTAFDLQGRRREVARLGLISSVTSWDLSPDGSQIAATQFGGTARVRIIDVASGTSRELTVPGQQGLDSLAWTADGQAMWATSLYTKGSVLLRITLRGESRELFRSPMWFERPTPSPDGRHLAFGLKTIDSNVWLLERASASR
jgi:Tol biopolymer transport system component